MLDGTCWEAHGGCHVLAVTLWLSHAAWHMLAGTCRLAGTTAVGSLVENDSAGKKDTGCVYTLQQDI